MNTEIFQKVRGKLQESMNPKIYEDNFVVDGLFNSTEVMIIGLEKSEVKDTFLRMFYEIKEKTQTFNNNKKLSALDTLYDTIIHTSNSNSINTTLIIENDADSFFQEYESSLDLYQRFDNSEFRGKLERRLRLHDKAEDQFIFLKRLETKVDEEKAEHLQKCTFTGDKEKCPETLFYSGLKYFTQQVLNKVSKNNLSSEYFTVQEKAQQTSKIDEVLAKLNELQLGQEIIYNDIEELKNLPNLKKKNFNEVVKGKIVDWGLKKVLDPQTLKWIFNKITDEDLPKLLE